MRLEIKNIRVNPTMAMRRAGYVFQYQEGTEMSFVRIMARAGYPRFHIYCRLEGANMIMNLHLDQKKETYGDSTRHHGEYDNSGPVQEEAERLKKAFGV
jgi:hypothetical protein